ncbi:MAG: hypothetical protein ACRD0R_09420 [Acidimicrobiales bacterium]
MRTDQTEQQAIEQRPERGGLRPVEGTRGSPGGSPGLAPPATRGHRRWPALVGGIVLVVLAVVLGIVLLDEDGDTSASRDDGATATEPEIEPAPETTAVPGTTEAVTPVPTSVPTPRTEAPVLVDGRHPVFLTGLDVGSRTVEFDLIQWLTGEAAREAYTADNPDDPGYPPNDLYVVNDNPRLRVLPVADDVPVTVLEHGYEPMGVTFEELPAFVADDVFPDDVWLWHNPFWLTVRDGTIIDIEEQYTP